MLALLPITRVYPSGADRATASAPTLPFAPTRILHHDGLAEAFRELLRDHARGEVRAAARRNATTIWSRESDRFVPVRRRALAQPPRAGPIAS